MTKKASLLLLIYFSVISTGQAMSIFDAGKVCTFSAVRATVTYEGKPVKGAKVSRWTKLKEEITDVTTTNDDGFFEFPQNFERSISTLMPIELVITQVITVEHNGAAHKIWINTKMKPEVNAELGGLPLNLKCELTHEPVFYENFGPLLETNCTWEK